MAIKKTTALKTNKKSKPVKKTSKLKEDLVEKKLTSMVDDEATSDKSKSSKRKNRFPWWGLISVILVLILATILLYEYNKDFHSNFSNMMNSTGFFQMKASTEVSKTVEPKEKFVIKMNIVYIKENAHQKGTIEQYLDNIEKNLKNTKVESVWMDKNSPEGKALIAKLGAKYLPIFTTDETIKTHPQYALFAPAINLVNGVYQFASEGMEYLSIPLVGDASYIGANPAKAKVVIIEYSSLTCHYCQQMQPILDKVVKAHPNQVSWVVKMFDRGSIDTVLEQSIECAGDQNKFQAMLDAMFVKQGDFLAAMSDPKDPQAAVYALIKVAAKSAGVNGDKVLACVKAGTHADKVARTTAEGQAYGVIGTPSFFINKQFVGGAIDEEALTKMIEEELKK